MPQGKDEDEDRKRMRREPTAPLGRDTAKGNSANWRRRLSSNEAERTAALNQADPLFMKALARNSLLESVYASEVAAAGALRQGARDRAVGAPQGGARPGAR